MTTLEPTQTRGLPWGSNIVRDVIGDKYAKGAAEGFMNAPSARQAMVQAGLDWDVTTGPLYVHHIGPGGVTRIEVPERYAIQRSDNGWPVGVVGERYEPLSNRAQAEFTDLLLTNAAGLAGMGATKDGGMGTRVYTVVEIEGDYRPGGMEDERLRVFLFTSNAFDGSTAFRASIGAWRMVCANTLHYTVKDLTTTFSVRHTATIQERMVIAQNAVREAAGWGEALVFDAEQLLQIPVAPDVGVKAIEALYPIPEVKFDDDGKQINAKAIANADRRQEAIVDVWADSPNLADVRQTGWGLLNAIAEWNDWGRSTRSEPMDRLLSRSPNGNPHLVNARQLIGELA